MGLGFAESLVEILILRMILLVDVLFLYNNRFCLHVSFFLCPQLRRSWQGVLISVCPCVRLCICVSVHSSRTMRARVLTFHIWIPHGKIVEHVFFFLSELSPFLELCPFEKIRMKSDACHILQTVHANVLTFHIWIPHGKTADLLSPFLELCPFIRIRMKSCQ